MTRYASRTSVSQDRSRSEIERLLMRFGADEFGYLARRDKAVIGFAYKGGRFEMAMALPARDEPQFTETHTGRVRAEPAAIRDWEQEVRRRWRSLCLVIKAMLVGVEDGVLDFEEAFMPYLIWGEGMTTAKLLLPRIRAALETGGQPPKLLEAAGAQRTQTKGGD